MTFHIDKTSLWFYSWCFAVYLATSLVTDSPWLAFVAVVITALTLEKDLRRNKKEKR